MEHNYSFDIHKFFHNKYNDLLTSDALRGFGLGIISIFIPLFLITKGYSLLDILLYEGAYHIIAVWLHYAIVKYSKVLRLKIIIGISYLFATIMFLLLFSIEKFQDQKYLFLAALCIINLCSSTFYWIGHHFYFIKATKKKDEGEKLSLLVGIPVIMSVISPLVGAFIITHHGYNLAFFVTLLFLFFAGVLMLLSPELDVKPKISREEIILGKSKAENSSYFFEGIVYTTMNIVWPLLLFFSAITIPTIGIVFFVGNVLYAILSYIAGKLTDKNKIMGMVTIGTTVHGSSVIARVFAKTINMIVGLQAISGMFSALWTIPIHTIFYKSSHEHTSNRILNREFYMQSGKIVYITILAIIFLFFGAIPSLIGGLIIGGISEFLMLRSLRKFITQKI
jgi:MFS family permease